MSLPTSKQSLRRRRLPLVIVAAVAIIAVGAGGALVSIRLLFPPPTTVAIDPADGLTEVGARQPIKLTFTRPVHLGSVEAALRVEPTLDGQLTSATDLQHFTWQPQGRWADLTLYTVTLVQLKDTAGHVVKSRRWHFTSTLVPRVVGLSTDNGTISSDGGEVPLGSSLKIGFNTDMDAPTVTLLLNATGTTLAWADPKTALFSTKGIPAGPLDVALGIGALDHKNHPVLDQWKLRLVLVFAVTEHTVPLQSPAVVQIPNDTYGARDQSGLQAASFIYEYLTEGGITRMSAIFTNIPDVIGPIRSGRLISFKITRHYRGINYFSGLSAGSFGVLNSDPVPTLFDTQGVYYRSTDRVAPNNLYIKGDQLKAYQDRSIPAFPLPTGTTQPLEGADAPGVSVPEHNTSYAYDTVTGTYTKTEDGHLMADALINQPVHIQLLIVMHTREFVTGVVEDIGGGHGRDFDMESGGTAEFYFRGKMATGHWSAGDRRTPFAFQLDSGQTVTIPRNLVWVDVVSS